jgi:hypothetical protein
MKRLKKIFLLTLLLSIPCLAQIFEGSIIVAGAGLLTRINYLGGNNTSPIKGGYGVYLSGQFRLSPLYSLELRPGWFSSSKFFSSTQLGLNLRRKFGENYYGAFGINFQFNISEPPGNLFQPKVTTYTINLTIGRKLFDHLLLHASICKTVDSYFGTYTYYKNYYTNYLDWILKFGLELMF